MSLICLKVRVCFWQVVCCGGEKKRWGRKKAVAVALVVGCEAYWLAGWVCGGFCNVKWERSKTVYFGKMSVSDQNKQ